MDRYNPGNVTIGELELIDEDEKQDDREED